MKFSALGDQAIIVTFGEEIGMDVYEKSTTIISSVAATSVYRNDRMRSVIYFIGRLL